MPEGGECSYELHHGEVVAVTRPRARHWKLQLRLTRLLETKLKGFGEVGMELPFRPVAEFELLAADVAAVERQRFDRIDPDDNLHGAPELVIEIKSPSNTAARIRERVTLCLANGSVQCWVVDQDKKSIFRISARRGRRSVRNRRRPPAVCLRRRRIASSRDLRVARSATGPRPQGAADYRWAPEPSALLKSATWRAGPVSASMCRPVLARSAA